MVKFSYAQQPRESKSVSEGKTVFTNIAVVGLNDDGTSPSANPGTPGYIEMVSSKGDTFYLYIDYNGKLKIASDIAVGCVGSTSPAMVGGWKPASGITVGTQTP
jgi:hypothetical protein